MASNYQTRSHKLLDFSQRFRLWNESNQSEILKRSNKTAVLICLFEEEDDIYVILIKRSSKRSCSSGEVSLPGGRRQEEGMDDIQTVLKEAEEEIGLDPALVDVITVLQPSISEENVAIIPVMGILWDKNAFNPVLDAEKVETVFYTPIEMFLKDKDEVCKEKRSEGDKDFANEKVHVNVISSMTAAALIKVASMVYPQSPDFQTQLCMMNHSRL